ncbi:MAG: hypothetical protein U1F87_18465, partial [Kiritimatiellia bacterium]
MKARIPTITALLIAAGAVLAQVRTHPYPKARVSFDDFKRLVAKVEPHRAERLVDLDTYINLYGYGYRNVYELDELVKVTGPR